MGQKQHQREEGAAGLWFFQQQQQPLAKCQFTSNFLKGMSSIYLVKLYAKFSKNFLRSFFVIFPKGGPKSQVFS